MPENQSQPNQAGDSAPLGEPRVVPQPDAPEPSRPSDAEAAHNPEEGGAVRDPRLDPNASADANRGDLGGRQTKDLEGEAQTGERLAERGGGRLGP